VNETAVAETAAGCVGARSIQPRPGYARVSPAPPGKQPTKSAVARVFLLAIVPRPHDRTQTRRSDVSRVIVGAVTVTVPLVARRAVSRFGGNRRTS